MDFPTFSSLCHEWYGGDKSGIYSRYSRLIVLYLYFYKNELLLTWHMIANNFAVPSK